MLCFLISKMKKFQIKDDIKIHDFNWIEMKSLNCNIKNRNYKVFNLF